MVNSLSRPNLRPDAPPPVGEAVRHTLSLPHSGTRPARGGGALDVGCFPSPRQSKQIKAYQASSRQTAKIANAEVGRGHQTARRACPREREADSPGKSSQIKVNQASSNLFPFHVARISRLPRPVWEPPEYQPYGPGEDLGGILVLARSGSPQAITTRASSLNPASKPAKNPLNS